MITGRGMIRPVTITGAAIVVIPTVVTGGTIAVTPTAVLVSPSPFSI
jgi:hypothetical protein